MCMQLGVVWALCGGWEEGDSWVGVNIVTDNFNGVNEEYVSE